MEHKCPSKGGKWGTASFGPAAAAVEPASPAGHLADAANQTVRTRPTPLKLQLLGGMGNLADDPEKVLPEDPTEHLAFVKEHDEQSRPRIIDLDLAAKHGIILTRSQN
ncbi:hypothetical protein ACFWPU_45900 [Streptomyces sp. NPDC058471]|uniref:hypothetical protein n=1 Tax=Streptomyces sp. NPDC058471 TaxID=3346516 RepID=UPI0036534ACF